MLVRRLLPPTFALSACVLVLGAAVAAAGQQLAGFGERPENELVVPQFSDRDVARFVTTLDSLLARDTDADKWNESAPRTLWSFARQLQAGRLTPSQETSVLRHLGEIETARPGAGSILQKPREMVSRLMIGKTAPEIRGRDLDGAEFRLSDYRGKVVVLAFSGEWCGICRSQYPYHRFLLELYKNWPLAIVSVDSSRSPATAKQVKAEQGLTYRSWWDGPSREGDGPIASAWNVRGWPTVYILDARGVIRFVDLRDEDLLKGVRQLLTEQNRPVPSQRK